MAFEENGWRVVLERNKHSKAGSFMVAPDSVMFALHLDGYGMPILPTRGAPIATYLSLDHSRVRLALAIMQASAESDLDGDVPDLVSSSSYDDKGPPATWLR